MIALKFRMLQKSCLPSIENLQKSISCTNPEVNLRFFCIYMNKLYFSCQAAQDLCYSFICGRLNSHHSIYSMVKLT